MNVPLGSLYIDGLGSAARPVGVPREYVGAPTEFSGTLSNDEVARVSRLVKDKLPDLIIRRKEVSQYRLKDNDLEEVQLLLLDKILNHNEETYIGICSIFFGREEEVGYAVGYDFEIVFSSTKDSVHVITSQYDDRTLFDGSVKICGMLDIDGCGKNELLIEKEFLDEDEAVTNLEIYKQKPDGEWMQALKIKTRRPL